MISGNQLPCQKADAKKNRILRLKGITPGFLWDRCNISPLRPHIWDTIKTLVSYNSNQEGPDYHVFVRDPKELFDVAAGESEKATCCRLLLVHSCIFRIEVVKKCLKSISDF